MCTLISTCKVVISILSLAIKEYSPASHERCDKLANTGTMLKSCKRTPQKSWEAYIYNLQEGGDTEYQA